MCLLCLQPPGVVIPERHLENGYRNNPDGMGYSFVYRGAIKTRKFMTDLDSFMDAYYTDTIKNPKSPFLVHFRYATHGNIDLNNVHPFDCNGGAFAHNGIFDIPRTKRTKDASDTRAFRDVILPKFPLGWQNDPVYRHILKEYCGYGNKLAFIWQDKTYTIINAEAGAWDNDVWYSNKGYMYVNAATATYPTPTANKVGVTRYYPDDDDYPLSEEEKLYTYDDDDAIRWWIESIQDDDADYMEDNLDYIIDQFGYSTVEGWCYRNGYLLTDVNGIKGIRKGKLIDGKRIGATLAERALSK